GTRGRGVAPIPPALVGVFGGAAKLVLGNAGDVAAQVGVVFQRLPGQRIMIVADAEQAAEAEHHVRHLAADLVDHDALDVADLFAVGPVDIRALDLVASDQAERLAIFHGHVDLPDVVFWSQREDDGSVPGKASVALFWASGVRDGTNRSGARIFEEAS